MEYFAGLDVSMDETHICVVDRDGSVMLETKTTTSPAAIAAGLAKAPDCKRIVFETGRMAPTLYHGLDALRLPVICIETRQAYQALKSLGTHKAAATAFWRSFRLPILPMSQVWGTFRPSPDRGQERSIRRPDACI